MAKIDEEKAEIFDTAQPIFKALIVEIKELTKKKPNETLNNNKVSLINKVLNDLKSVLKDEPSGKYLEILNDDDLPLYSDVLLAMAQFDASMKIFLRKYKTNYGRFSDDWDYKFEEEDDDDEVYVDKEGED